MSASMFGYAVNNRLDRGQTLQPALKNPDVVRETSRVFILLCSGDNCACVFCDQTSHWKLVKNQHLSITKYTSSSMLSFNRNFHIELNY